MKNIALILLSLFCFFEMNLYSQSCPKKFIEAKYKKQYYPNGHALSQEYVLIGMPKEALAEEDKYSETPESDLGSQVVATGRDTNFTVQNAYTYVYDAIKKNDIILLNERHNRPQHRVFLYFLLDSLKQLGVKSVFLETLAYSDDDSLYHSENNIQTWGIYTQENIFNQVSQKLTRLNYNVYSYEVRMSRQIDTSRIGQKLYFINKSDPKWVPFEADRIIAEYLYSKDDLVQREAEQAIKIYQKLIRNKIQKAIVYCGYSHSFKSGKYMAGLLQYLLGKPVFSVDQIYLNEHSQKKFENPLYAKFATVSYPFIIYDSNKPVHSIQYSEKGYTTDTLIDVAVASPRTIYIKNRPTWLELGGDRKRYPLSQFIDANKYGANILVTIYENEAYERDKINAVPEDVFQVLLQSKDYDTILTPNKKYHLFITKDSQTLVDKIIDAK